MNTTGAFLSGYENVNAGSGSSLAVTGASPMTTYNYRIRATSPTSTSGNSSIQSVTTPKSDPVITAWPTAAAISYGQALSAATLSGGASTPTGTFAFAAPATVPNMTGLFSSSVVFTPTDTANYNTATNPVSVMVNESYQPVYGTSDSQNFDGFTTADLLDSANGWSTDDTYVDPDDVYSNGFRPDAGGGIAASIGGYIASSPQYRMKYQFDPGTSDRLVFTWKQNIESSNTNYPSVDRFGWEFKSGTNSLFSLKMIQYVDSNGNGTWDKTDETTDPVTPAEPLAGDNASLQDQPGGSPAALVTSNVVVAGYKADGTRLTTADQPNFAVVARDEWQEFRVIVDLREGKWWAQVYSGGAFQNLMGDAGVALPVGTTTVDSISALWELNDTTENAGLFEYGGSNQMLFDDLTIQGRKIVHLGLSTPSGAIYNGSAQGATATDESTGTAQISYSLQYSGVTNTSVPVNYGTYITTAGINTNTTPYFAVVGTNAARLYTNSATITLQYVIDRKSVTITGVGVADRIYNGNTNATITGTPTISGKVTGDDVSVAGAGSASFTTADAGAVKLATISGYSLTGTAASNYQLTGLPISASAEISKKTLTVTAQTQTKTYGDADPALTYGSSGLVGSDSISGSLTREVGSNVGTYAIEQGSLDAGSNYNINFTGANLTIGEATLSVVADSQSKTYGDADPVLTYTVIGLVNGDTEAGVISGALGRVSGEDVGSHPIQQGTLDAGANYNITFSAADLTIGAASLTVAADPQSKTYGDLDPSLTYGVSGLVNGDTEAGVITGALERATGDDVGTYAINQGTLDAGSNYIISFTGAHLVVGVATLTVTADPQSKTYGDADPALTYTVSGLVNGDTEPGVITGFLDRNLGEDVGNYSIVQGALDAGLNYVLNFQSNDLSIIARDLSGPDLVTLVQPLSGLTYDGSPKDWTVSSSLGLSSSDFVFQYYGRITTHYLMSSTAPTDAGEYTVQVTLNNPNYTGGTVFEDFTILKATPANVTAPTASAITLGQDLAQSSLTGGSAEGVDGNALSGTFAFDDSTLIPSSTGSYSAGVTFTPDSANYETVSLTVSVTVNAATTPAEDYLADFGLTGANALLTADPDGDGLSNAQEFAFGAVPNVAGSLPITTSNTGGSLKMVFLGRTTGVTYNVVTYTSLTSGTPSTNAPTTVNPQPSGLPTGYTQYEASLDSSTGTRKFMKVDAVIP
jgi:hypothetical protein